MENTHKAAQDGFVFHLQFRGTGHYFSFFFFSFFFLSKVKFVYFFNELAIPLKKSLKSKQNKKRKKNVQKAGRPQNFHNIFFKHCLIILSIIM